MQLLPATGVTALCEMLGFTLFDEGDGLLLTMPCYTAFSMDFSLKAKYGLHP
jgi:1-aminocyclopropane-1-carboxylate synthase